MIAPISQTQHFNRIGTFATLSLYLPRDNSVKWPSLNNYLNGIKLRKRLKQTQQSCSEKSFELLRDIGVCWVSCFQLCPQIHLNPRGAGSEWNFSFHWMGPSHGGSWRSSSPPLLPLSPESQPPLKRVSQIRWPKKRKIPHFLSADTLNLFTILVNGIRETSYWGIVRMNSTTKNPIFCK